MNLFDSIKKKVTGKAAKAANNEVSSTFIFQVSGDVLVEVITNSEESFNKIVRVEDCRLNTGTFSNLHNVTAALYDTKQVSDCIWNATWKIVGEIVIPAYGTTYKDAYENANKIVSGMKFHHLDNINIIYLPEKTLGVAA